MAFQRMSGIWEGTAVTVSPSGQTQDSFTSSTNRASDGLLDSNITSSDVPTGTVAPPPGVPEPATLVLAALGFPLIGLARAFRRKKVA